MEEQLGLSRARCRNLLQSGLLQSAEYFALLAAHGLHPPAPALALVGSVCMAAGQHRRALGFLEQAQREAEMSWSADGRRGSVEQALPTSVGLPASFARAQQQPHAAAPGGASALLVQIAEAHEQLGERSAALAALERIPPVQRCARVFAWLGRLYLQSGMRPSAIAAFKACLKLCPHAVEAALALADLRVPAGEVKALVSSMAEPAALQQLALQFPELLQGASSDPKEATDAGAAAVEGAVAEAATAAEEEAGVAAAAVDGGTVGMAVDGFSPLFLQQESAEQQGATVAAAEAGEGTGLSGGMAIGSTMLTEHSEEKQSAQQQKQAHTAAGGTGGTGASLRRQALLSQPTVLLRGESARECELVPDAAAVQVMGADEAAGIQTPPAGSPKAVVTGALTLSPSSGQATPAQAASPAGALQQPPGPCQRRRMGGGTGAGSGRAGGQTQQGQVSPAARRMLRLRSPPEAAAAGGPQQRALDAAAPPAGASSGPAAQQQQGVAALQPERQQQRPMHQAAPAQHQQAQAGAGAAAGKARLPPALVSAAQQSLEFVCQLVDLVAGLAAEDKLVALPAAQRLLEMAPNHTYVLAYAAQCQADHGSADSALALFARARQHDPHCLVGAARYADLLRRAGDHVALAQLAYHVSMEAGQAGQGFQGGGAEPWLVAAAAKELAGDLYEAMGLLRKALERDAGSAEAHLQIGRLVHRIHAAAGGLGGGLADFCSALRLRRSVRVYREAVDAALACDMVMEAQRLAQEAQRTFPACKACRVLLARALAHQSHKHAQAEALLREALQADPRCEEAALALAALLLQDGRCSEARQVLARQLAEAASEALHVAAGHVAVAGEDLESAVMHFNAALGYNPHSLTAAQGLQEVEQMLAPAKEESSDEEGEGAMGYTEDDGDIPFGI